ncbi:hypothetical protein [Solitalea lacus]|uniref:hypothetical protein n=1 Tax=Solitalea lacus TaxID=2911172 RepID=UPI001EDA521E|nr:hypothetical protein [Solitalea lacus]UKJ06921.1 hypothetical protein L2B55_15480 [Solitalea lacus]
MAISYQKLGALVIGIMVLISLVLLFVGFPGNLILGFWGIALVFTFIFGILLGVRTLFFKVKNRKAKKSTRKTAAGAVKSKR